MATFRRFQELFAWQKARKLTNQVYLLTHAKGFSKDYGLKSQIQRAAVSTMSNIAEGYARGTPNQFKQYLDISRGSAAEVQSLVYVALDQEYLDQQQFEELFSLTDEVISLVAGLKRSIQTKNNPK